MKDRPIHTQLSPITTPLTGLLDNLNASVLSRHEATPKFLQGVLA